MRVLHCELSESNVRRERFFYIVSDWRGYGAAHIEGSGGWTFEHRSLKRCNGWEAVPLVFGLRQRNRSLCRKRRVAWGIRWRGTWASVGVQMGETKRGVYRTAWIEMIISVKCTRKDRPGLGTSFNELVLFLGQCCPSPFQYPWSNPKNRTRGNTLSSWACLNYNGHYSRSSGKNLRGGDILCGEQGGQFDGTEDTEGIR